MALHVVYSYNYGLALRRLLSDTKSNNSLFIRLFMHRGTNKVHFWPNLSKQGLLWSFCFRFNFRLLHFPTWEVLNVLFSISTILK